MTALADQLSLFAERQTPPADLVGWLEQYLNGRPAWVTAADVVQALYPPEAPSDSRKRFIRELAAASEWIISGQKGYKHLSHATAEEITHFVHWMESQAKQMTIRANSVRKNAHRIVNR